MRNHTRLSIASGIFGQPGGSRADLCSRERGSAILVVMAITVILTVTVSALIGAVVYQTQRAHAAEAENRAGSYAQLGMETYLARLKSQPSGWWDSASNQVMSGSAGVDGTWTVVASPASSTVTAVGVDIPTGYKHTIVAKVRMDSFVSDAGGSGTGIGSYTILSDAPLSLGNADAGSDITISGAVRSNTTVALNEPMHVSAIAGQPVTNGFFADTSTVTAKKVSFSTASEDFPSLLYMATSRWEDMDRQYGAGFYRFANDRRFGFWAGYDIFDVDDVTKLSGNALPTFTTYNPTNDQSANMVGVYIEPGFSGGSSWRFMPVFAPTVSCNGNALSPEDPFAFARHDPLPTGRFGPLGDYNSGTYHSVLSNRVVYVGGNLDVYVKAGQYSSSMTIVSERDIYIMGSVTRATGSNATLGLVAKRDIVILAQMPTSANTSATYTGDWYSGTYTRGLDDAKRLSLGDPVAVMPNGDLTVQAAMLAIDGAIYTDPDTLTASSTVGPPRRVGTLKIQGALVARGGLRGVNFANDYNASVGGWAKTVIEPDPALSTDPPPSFPSVNSASLQILAWDEYTTAPGGGDGWPRGFVFPNGVTPPDGVVSGELPPGGDIVAPVTDSDAQSTYAGPALITLTARDDVGGSGVAATYYKLDDDPLVNGTSVPVLPPLPGAPVGHTLKYWSVDNAGNQEGSRYAFFTSYSATVPGLLTLSDAQSEYLGRAVITLLPVNPAGGAGIAATYYCVDGATLPTTGTVITLPAPAPASGPATYTVEFWSVDRAGVEETPRKSVTVRVLPGATMAFSGMTPANNSVTILSGPGISIIASATCAITGATATLDGTSYPVELRVRAGGPLGSYMTQAEFDSYGADPPDAFQYEHQKASFLTSGLASGVHTVTVVFTDATGSASKTWTFTISSSSDTVPPTTSSDATATYANWGQIHLMADDGPTGSGVAHTYYTWDGGPRVESTLIGVAGVGTHRIEFWSEDRSGNVEATKTATFTVTDSDFTAPTTTANVESSYVGTATISLVPTDGVGGSSVAETYYRIDAGEATTGTCAVVAPPATGRVQHSIRYWSVDQAGNVEGPHAALFTSIAADLRAPETSSTITYAGPDSEGTATITLTANDDPDSSGIAGTWYRIATERDAGRQTTGTVFTIAPPKSFATTCTITYGSADRAGNVEATKTVTVIVKALADTTPPVTTSNAVASYTGPANITLTATDVDGWGVAHTYYQLDTDPSVEGTSFSVSTIGSHTLEFWSVDKNNNEETPHTTANFKVAAAAPVEANIELDPRYPDSYAYYRTFAVIAISQDSYQILSATATVDGVAVTASLSYSYYDWGEDPEGDWSLTKTQAKVSFGGIRTGIHTITVRFKNSNGQSIERTWKSTSGGVWSEYVVATLGVASVASAPAPDMTPPTTTSDALATFYGIGQIRLTPADNAGGSGVAHTFYRWDDGPQIESTMIGVSGAGTHHIDFWSVDAAGNVGTQVRAEFQVVQSDITAPTTVSDAVSSYAGTATVTLTATDDAGGSGVSGTFYRLDSGPAQSGTVIVVAAPLSGSAQHSIVFWSVDNAGNAEAERSVVFTVAPPAAVVAPLADVIAPTTSSNAVASYVDTARITLTASDNAGGSGVKSTYFSIDDGPQQVGTLIVIPAPATGSAGHHIDFCSVDNAGNVEGVKSFAMSVVAIDPANLATLGFRWYSGASSSAALGYTNVLTGSFATSQLHGPDLVWAVAVPAGQSYRMWVDTWYDDVTKTSGRGEKVTPVLTPGQVYIWDYRN